MLPWLTEFPAQRFNDVRDTSLAKLVRDDMLALILKGVLIPGQRINEPDVAARLGVSRVPVREALRELESSGLVVARKHAGVFVRQLDASEIRDLYQMRGLLDGFAGRQAALLVGEPKAVLLALLDDSVHAMKEASARHEVQRYYGENLRFHWAIIEAAGNQTLTETYRSIVQKLHLSRLKNLSHDVGMQASIAEHAEIVQVLRQGDPQRCEDLMAHHVSDAFTRLVHATPPVA
ncbi:MAG: FCD domain-containing protein [Polaromonas sp.]|uniref:GntR family transcriptional regulator n=1 Tax=Polaromonas sp. TaxID=1869339 RepID=UPI002730B4E4|nr:FCD domain-containing protein [Polaromonas sp.]MDP1743008.1 FCD domain-containing protein [Polaromonas sp.]MDP3354803.1 FCD domain-containing protein [Polaromonas sp.]MDP3750608.1 FCD domain-containing protein [Polaromonas sp.]